MFVIIKQIQNKKTGKTLPVILIDNLSEVLEFKKKEDANKLCEILNINSDSGHIYSVKEITKKSN